MPIATFSSFPERGAKARRKRTYTRFVYPYPDDLHGTRNKLESLKDENPPSCEAEVGWLVFQIHKYMESVGNLIRPCQSIVLIGKLFYK